LTPEICNFFVHSKSLNPRTYSNTMSSAMLRTMRVANLASRQLMRSSTQPSVVRFLRPAVLGNARALPQHSFHSSCMPRANAGDPMQGIDPNHPFIQQLRQNPHILQQLADFTVLLQEKGMDVSSGKQPGFGQVKSLSTHTHTLSLSHRSKNIQPHSFCYLNRF
jgi:hypothetical protein